MFEFQLTMSPGSGAHLVEMIRDRRGRCGPCPHRWDGYYILPPSSHLRDAGGDLRQVRATDPNVALSRAITEARPVAHHGNQRNPRASRRRSTTGFGRCATYAKRTSCS